MINSHTMRSPFGVILNISPFRRVTISMAFPETFSGKSMVNSSIGSCFTPSISFIITCGCPICNSYPSRRMVSIKTERCNTPRPKTINLSADPVSCKRMARLRSNSFSKRSLICLEVTNFPSFPKKGESLMVNNILMVGSSIAIVGKASGFSASAMVSPISNPSNPITAQISPALTSSTFLRPKPSKRLSSLMRCFEISPSRFTKATGIPAFNCPRCKRPMAIRPV